MQYYFPDDQGSLFLIKLLLLCCLFLLSTRCNVTHQLLHLYCLVFPGFQSLVGLVIRTTSEQRYHKHRKQ
jgi:hypothetical protein